jgi:hypothetical protein
LSSVYIDKAAFSGCKRAYVFYKKLLEPNYNSINPSILVNFVVSRFLGFTYKYLKTILIVTKIIDSCLSSEELNRKVLIMRPYVLFRLVCRDLTLKCLEYDEDKNFIAVAQIKYKDDLLIFNPHD